MVYKTQILKISYLYTYFFFRELLEFERVRIFLKWLAFVKQYNRLLSLVHTRVKQYIQTPILEISTYSNIIVNEIFEPQSINTFLFLNFLLKQMQ